MNRSVIKNIFLAGLSGVLGFMAFPPFEFSFLAWICLIPLLLMLKTNSGRGTFVYPFFSGLVFFGGLLCWLANVTVPGMLLLVVLLAGIYGIFGVLTGYIFKYSMNFLIIPSVWVVLEYIRSYLFTGFPWGLLGYSQNEAVKLIQVADVTGAYGISFLIVAVNVGIFAVIIRSKKRITYAAIVIFLLASAFCYGAYKSNNYFISDGPRVSVIQGNIPQERKWDPAFSSTIINRYAHLTEVSLSDDPDIVIWPETSYPYLVGDINSSDVSISGLSAENRVPILAGIVRRQGNDFYNSAVMFSTAGEVTDVYDKIHLVPFGEYIPFEKYFETFRNYIDKPIGNFRKGNRYTLFPVKSSFSAIKGDIRTRRTDFYKFGVLICFEDILPDITREFVKNGADFMINITNDAWFGPTAAARQHLQASVFRAVENRRAVVRSANTGISAFIDSRGRVSSLIESDGEEIFVSGVASGNVDIYDGLSYYTVYGDVFVYFCALFMIFLFIAEAHKPIGPK